MRPSPAMKLKDRLDQELGGDWRVQAYPASDAPVDSAPWHGWMAWVLLNNVSVTCSIPAPDSPSQTFIVTLGNNGAELSISSVDVLIQKLPGMIEQYVAGHARRSTLQRYQVREWDEPFMPVYPVGGYTTGPTPIQSDYLPYSANGTAIIRDRLWATFGGEWRVTMQPEPAAYDPAIWCGWSAVGTVEGVSVQISIPAMECESREVTATPLGILPRSTLIFPSLTELLRSLASYIR
jgi:hypothetical protein